MYWSVCVGGMLEMAVGVGGCVTGGMLEMAVSVGSCVTGVGVMSEMAVSVDTW